MESEEELYSRCVETISLKVYGSKYPWPDEMEHISKEVRELYFIERLKQLTPSDKAMEDCCSKLIYSHNFFDERKVYFRIGFKKAIELLTKNK